MIHELIGSMSFIRIMQEATKQEILSLLTEGFWDSRRGSFAYFVHDHKIVVTVRPRRLEEKTQDSQRVSHGL